MSKLANFYWDGPMSEYQKISVLSFLQAGFDVNVWTYDHGFDLPESINIMDASEILPKSMIGKYVFDSPLSEKSNIFAIFSDVFRAHVVHETGGWWFDIDVFCIKPVEKFLELAEKNDFVFGQELDGNTVWANATVMYFRSEHLALDFVKHIDWVLENSEDRRWGYTGPIAVTNFLNSINGLHKAQPSNIFYPIDFANYLDAYDPKKRGACKIKALNSYAYHWWNSMSRERTSVMPHKNSYLGQLFATILEKYDVTNDWNKQ